MEIANRLEAENRRRQELERKTFREAAERGVRVGVAEQFPHLLVFDHFAITGGNISGLVRRGIDQAKIRQRHDCRADTISCQYLSYFQAGIRIETGKVNTGQHGCLHFVGHY